MIETQILAGINITQVHVSQKLHCVTVTKTGL